MDTATSTKLPKRRVVDLKGATTLLRKAEVAARLGVSVDTINRWMRADLFVRPIYLTPESPARWRASDIANWIEKKRASRRPRPKPRGMLKKVEA